MEALPPGEDFCRHPLNSDIEKYGVFNRFCGLTNHFLLNKVFSTSIICACGLNKIHMQANKCRFNIDLVLMSEQKSLGSLLGSKCFSRELKWRKITSIFFKTTCDNSTRTSTLTGAKFNLPTRWRPTTLLTLSHSVVKYKLPILNRPKRRGG